MISEPFYNRISVKDTKLSSKNGKQALSKSNEELTHRSLALRGQYISIFKKIINNKERLRLTIHHRDQRLLEVRLLIKVLKIYRDLNLSEDTLNKNKYRSLLTKTMHNSVYEIRKIGKLTSQISVQYLKEAISKFSTISKILIALNHQKFLSRRTDLQAKINIDLSNLKVIIKRAIMGTQICLKRLSCHQIKMLERTLSGLLNC